MKLPMYSSRYFITIGIFIFLCFTGIWFFIASNLGKRTKQIGVELATKNYQLKSNIFQNEFNTLVKGIGNLESILPEIQTKEAFIQNQKITEALLLSQREINTGWYAIAGKNDTIYNTFKKRGINYRSSHVQKYQKDWIDAQLRNKDTMKRNGAIIGGPDTLRHWLASAKYKLADGNTILFGLDINLKELQQHLWTVDQLGRASAFIIDENHDYVTNPLVSVIGTRMDSPTTSRIGKTYLADSISYYQLVTSSYLQVPVFRYYTPMNMPGMKWTMVIETPEFIADESASGIEKYMTILFISAAVIILSLIVWSQAKWQKEFMLRQQSEMKRQEISIEKQALSIVAERQQKENALLQLNTLKEKVNPHFLFNSLSSLNALIAQNPELAKSFVVKLSRVYRYVLESYPNGLATVYEELNFVKAYFFLMKIRFGEALQPLEIQISDAHLQEKIPFMSLQTLIENAVKHNMISKTKPLNIKIENLEGYIVVTNNLQLRNDVRGSGKQGLNYLQSTYAYFGAEKIRYGVEGNTYKCYLPIIQFTP